MFGSELKELKDLLSRMLVKDPAKRLKNLADVRSHPWFAKHISFSDIEARKVKAPFEPQIASEESLEGERDEELEAISHLFL